MITVWLKVKDNAEGSLSTELLSGGLSINLQVGEGAKFPSPGRFVVTIDNEKILCDDISGDTLVVHTRGFDGTIVSDHTQNTKVELRVIAKHLDDVTAAVNALEGRADQFDLDLVSIGGDIAVVQGNVDTVQGNLDTHSADNTVHHHDHDHSASGAQGGNIGVSSLVTNEVPGGLVNGSNTAFTTAAAFITGSLRVYKNGIRLKGGGNDYTETSQGFTMVTAPATGTVLLVEYNTQPSVFSTGSTSFIYSELCGGTPNGVLTAFTTAFAYVPLSTVVFLDGVRMRRDVDYTESASQQITFSSAPTTGSEILIDYQSAVSAAGNADTLDGYHASATPAPNSICPLDANSRIPLATMSKINYNSTEQLTNEYDIDGYPVYMKVITGTFNAINGSTNIAHGITGLRTLVDYTWIVNLTQSTVSNSGQLMVHREAGGNWCSPVAFNTTNIVIQSSYGWGTSAFRLTLKYTKN